MRFELRRVAQEVGLQLDRAQLWNWEHVRLVPDGAARFAVEYFGRRERCWEVCDVLGLREEPHPARGHGRGAYKVLASEVPLPGALHVPFHVDAVVRLRRPVEEILAGYRGDLARIVKKYGRRFHTRRVVDDQEIERIQHEMLEPFGTAHHGAHTVNLSLEDVRRIAKDTGRLDLAYLDGEEIGCHLGCTAVYKGKRYWNGVRVGYPETIYSDSRRFRIDNQLNVHLALQWALENDFDFYNMGMTPACPDGGLLEFKRRRGATLTADFVDAFFWLRLPARERARFLWKAPLFSVERGRLILHLGLPAGPTDAEVLARYHEMGFDGLSQVQLYCAQTPGAGLLDALADHYVRYDRPPRLVEVPG